MELGRVIGFSSMRRVKLYTLRSSVLRVGLHSSSLFDGIMGVLSLSVLFCRFSPLGLQADSHTDIRCRLHSS